MRTTLLAITLAAVSVCATAAFAQDPEIRLPTRTKAKATLVVDEAGTILGGSVPARVDVANVPLPVEVVNQATTPQSACSTPGGGVVAISEEAPTDTTLGELMAYCDSLVESGAEDWRVPTLEELEYAAGGGAVVPGTRSNMLLRTRTRIEDSVSQNWALRLSDGALGSLSSSGAHAAYGGRCVR